MSDDTKHMPHHDKFVSLDEDHQIDYWTGTFTRDDLAMAIRRVGHSVQALEKYLKHG
jgi:hypothetical protein